MLCRLYLAAGFARAAVWLCNRCYWCGRLRRDQYPVWGK